MRLPFFRSSKVETTKITVAVPPKPSRPNLPPAATSRTNLHLAETQLMSHPLNTARTPEPPVSPQAESRPVPPTNGQTIPVSLKSISQQLPGNFLATVGTENVRRTTVNIPAEWVLPQLARGRITITMADLITLLPADVTGRPLPTGNSQHAIVLPLSDIVSALPVDLLQPQNQTEVDLNTPEFAQFPNLIDDAAEKSAAEVSSVEQVAPTTQESATGESTTLDQAPVPTDEISTLSAPETTATEATAAAVEEEQPSPFALANHMARPIPSANEAPPQPATPETAPIGADAITVSLRSLVAVMPDQYFICSRTDLWRRIDLDTRIPLPADLVVPQLKTARVRLPLSVAIGLMPRSILASPLPSISDDTIPIALQEIVPQLPATLFSSQTKQSDLEEIDFSDSDIPTPFAEKDFAPATVEIRAVEPAQLPPSPLEGEVREGLSTPKAFEAPAKPESLPEAAEISSGTLEDEAADIFAEKPAVAEPTSTPVAPAAAEPAAEPTQEPRSAEALEAVQPPAVAAEAQAAEPATIEQPVAEQAAAEPVAEVSTPGPITAEPASPAAPEPAEAAAEVPVPAPVAAEQQPTVEARQTTDEAVVPPPAVEGAQAGQPETTSEQPSTEAAPEPQSAEPATPAPGVGSTPDQVLANLNRWSLADLVRIEGIDPVLAKRIIEFRDTHGGFKSLEELHQIPGIGRRLFRSLASPPRRHLNRLLGVEHNEELTLQEIVRLTSRLQGVAGCILAMSDGVFLTGELPPHLDRETISVFAPQLFRKVGRYMKELGAGQVTRLSVFTDQQPISILRAGEIFLIVLHDNRHFSKALLHRCERISQELARLSRQRSVE
jgi:DNA uptake protein ComE-like DNA-binding protein/predicted regulator of Ras-like GTPase activity (Roadblock/LC7/MglB family)